MIKFIHGRRSVFFFLGGGEGAPTKGALSEKRGTYKEKPQSKNILFLDTGGPFYPYIVIRLSGMISLFVFFLNMFQDTAEVSYSDGLNIYLGASEAGEQKC